MHPSATRAFVSLAFAWLAMGCGHPATVEECEEIVERIARLELEQRKVDPAEVTAEIDSTKKAVRESTMKECVGKRITKQAMECVRKAKTSQEIVDSCFD
jgi:hypothetical protein